MDQFEKFCSVLLEAEGFHVHRSGGARPDGGVDLIAVKENQATLVQCKHWRTWKIKEPTVREMLGSMTDFKVNRGAIYTLNGWTHPAAEFAEKHEIELVDDHKLAERAARRLSQVQLERLLSADEHHCPKCECAMVERKGPKGRFWGCSAYPRCRTTMQKLGAR
jgi:restriction system protein